MKGKVKRWLDLRGYGFIQPEDGGDDVFVHNSDLISVQVLKEGQDVEYEVEDSPKGPRAVRVKVL